MSIKTLFNIILKIIGLLLLKEVVTDLLPTFIATLSKLGVYSASVLIFNLIIIGIYVSCAILCISKSNALIDKLNLDKGFAEQYINANIDTATIFSAATIIVGGLIVFNEVPNFLQLAYSYFMLRHTTHSSDGFQSSYILFSTIKIIIGLLLIGNRAEIVKFLLKSQKREDEIATPTEIKNEDQHEQTQPID